MAGGMAIERCRIWWPRRELQLEQGPDSARLILFGWFFTSSGCLDIVVSAAVPQDQILRSFATLDALKTIVLSSNKRMPVSLQESSTFTILGDCGRHFPGELEEYCCTKQLPLDAQFVRKEHFGTSRNSIIIGSVGNGDQHPIYDHRRWRCDCCVLDGFLDACRKSAVKEGSWVQLFCKSGMSFKSNLNQTVICHLYLDGQQIEINHCHVILYEVPTFGRNHFSLGVDAPRKLKASFKKPNWINDLQKQPSFLDLDSILLALNCSNAARLPVIQECSTSSSGAYFVFASVYDVLVQVTWHCMGIFLASASTILYIMILVFRKCLSHMSQYLMLHKVFKHSWSNIHLRSCQILYWPFVLQDTSLSSTMNVEYAHKAAIRKHALWSSIAVDLLMGSVLGAAFLLNTETICIWTVALVHHMTDAILRSGCVWLMGVPAGFKLNTELAELLGMISLNAIQIYSTLWFFVGGYLRHIIQGIAFSGIILGLTAPVSFFIDIIQLATLHVTMLHWLISSIYSRQIQTVASLWRLFRGRKWNPLRQRLDSYDYTVEQHVVGSLLFTPVLLLIPTTSVFYVFFSILTTTVIWVCVMLEIAITVIQSTPYAELTLWVMRRQRFPAGIFFLHVPSSGRAFEDDDLSTHQIRGCSETKTKDAVHGQSETLVSELNCNYATLVQVIRSNYERVFNRTGFSFCKQLAYGILSGERVPSSLQLQPSPSFPWMNIGITEYWMHCHGSVLSCAPKR
ncbi:hypothetical protein GQ55_6G287900 [Panicum hallii var. hallii]|uniref:Uncharacterized protein n=2 Tax=Panicum hallii var. hallii TaxID=1504633 RepID=A0A2T7DAQ4_9POAL|nr:hypothetical protein GQ55_6G287900 [Panicum hallii var. hallii]PUZ52667.1 hypothetical protein GQ55_6G287900 [Panicum hallii var. hallii]